MTRKKMDKSTKNMMGNSRLTYVILGILILVVTFIVIYFSVTLMKRPFETKRLPETGISTEQEQQLVDFSETRSSAGGAENITHEQKKMLEDFYKSRQ